ncbi:Spo0E like sporulation regulatory protein [Paenibacillus alvei DSM 29]|nr:Spo0E like sporulation regulatory protein [Paenibacillus alvei DSM 29]
MCLLHCPHEVYMMEKIELLKQRLISIVNERNDFTDDEVIRVSQELDVYLLAYQKKQLCTLSSGDRGQGKHAGVDS